MNMLPGMSQLKDLNIDDSQLVKVGSIIQSMTSDERDEVV